MPCGTTDWLNRLLRIDSGPLGTTVRLHRQLLCGLPVLLCIRLIPQLHDLLNPPLQLSQLLLYLVRVKGRPMCWRCLL